MGISDAPHSSEAHGSILNLLIFPFIPFSLLLRNIDRYVNEFLKGYAVVARLIIKVFELMDSKVSMCRCWKTDQCMPNEIQMSMKGPISFKRSERSRPGGRPSDKAKVQSNTK